MNVAETVKGSINGLLHMPKDQRDRAVAMWGIAFCLFSAAAGWMFMRFGQAWSIADLPSSPFFSYIIPAYIVTEVAMIPVTGKLVDVFGMRKLLFIGPALYVLAALFCVLSTSVEMLVACRLVQGFGAGIVLGIAFTAVGKFYDPVKRGKCHELMTAAFAIGSLFASAVGYFFTDNFNWRFSFLFFAGIMLIGMIIGLKFLPGNEHKEGKADITAMVLTALTFGLATLYTQRVNVDYPLHSFRSVDVICAIILLIALLFYYSRRTNDPVIPVHTTWFEKKLIILMFLFSLCGLGLLQYFFKMYLTYYSFDIYRASLMSVFLILGAAGPSLIGCRKVFTTGIRPWVTVGAVFVTISLVVFHFFAEQGEIQFMICMFLFGFGLGCIVTEILCSLQSVVEKRHMGQHTGNLMAVRMIGILVGNAVVGAYIKEVIQNNFVQPVINLNQTTNLMGDILGIVSNTVSYSTNSMREGLMATVLIMAVITFILAFVGHSLSKDDVEALEKEKEQ